MNQKPEVKQKRKEYQRKYYQRKKENWEKLSDEEQLQIMNKKGKEILSNQSTLVRYTRWCVRCHQFKKMSGRSRGHRVCDECKKKPGSKKKN